MIKGKKYLALALLSVTALGSYFVSTTYAKYTSQATGVGVATAAKWSFKVGGKDITRDSATFNLLDTMYDSDMESEEEDVVEGKIAPGMGGYINLDVENDSDVKAKYTLNFTNNSDLPLTYGYYDSEDDEIKWGSPLSELLEEQSIGEPNIEIESGQVDSYEIYWKWDFDADDNTDTAIGQAATNPENANKLSFTVSITATQVD